MWAQPAAVVDIMQLLEGSESVQSVSMIDAFTGGWCDSAAEAAFLSLRFCVPAGCTGIAQLTDVGLAQPSKAALQRFQTELKDRLREKARQENVALHLQLQSERRAP